MIKYVNKQLILKMLFSLISVDISHAQEEDNTLWIIQQRFSVLERSFIRQQ